MSKFSESNTKAGRFLARNSGKLISGLKHEVIAKVYRSSRFRALSRKFYKPKEPEKWVFLVGCYNSGTTILRRLLESHPDIAAFPAEGVTMTDAFPNMEAGGYPRMMYANRHLWDEPIDNSKERADMAKRDWARWWPKDAKVYMEKSIDHSIRMAWLDENFPNAYFIFIVRNGYCVSEGIRRRARPLGAAATKLGDCYSVEMVAEQWKAINAKIEEDGEKISRFHKVRYEDLMEDPILNLRTIFRFLDLEIPPLTTNRDSVIVDGIAHQILNQNKKSISRITTKDLDEMSKILGDSLAHYGYRNLTD